VFVPTPNDVVARMLKMAGVKKTDVLYDLGCGDGRIVVTAAKRIGCKAVGYDIDPERVKESRDNAARNKVEQLVTIEQQDIFKVDLSRANVIALYLLPEMNAKLVPQFEKMKPGSRIVAHNYGIEGLEADETVTMKSREDNVEHTIYLWTTPLKKPEATTTAE
jgi:ribosomal protein L11 methylase PrmA